MGDHVIRGALAAGAMLLSLCAWAQPAGRLSAESAALMDAYYAAFEPGADVAAAVDTSTSPAWQSCATECVPRDRFIGMLSGFRQAVPDMRWRIDEYLQAGDRIIVRGEGTGTPAGAFMGVPHQGRQFKILSIDIHTIAAGRIVHTYHLEDWAHALRQLGGH